MILLSAPARVSAQENGSIAGLVYLGVGVGSLVRLLESDVTLHSGDVVRIQRWQGGEIRGTLRSVSPDAVTLSVSDTAMVVPRAAVRRIQRFDGIERRWAQGFGKGFLIGGAVGAVAGGAIGPGDSGEFDFSRGELAIIGGIIGAYTGSVIGAVAGAFHTGEHWRSTHPLPAALALTPARDGMRVGVSLAF